MVAVVDGLGRFTFVDVQTGKVLQVPGLSDHSMSFFWGWMMDQADGKHVLIAEIKKASYQRGSPKLWVFNPQFERGNVDVQETVVAIDVKTFPEEPQVVLFREGNDPSVTMISPWQPENGIRYEIYVDNRRVVSRLAPRGEPYALVGPSLIGQSADGRAATVAIEQFYPGLEPGKPMKYTAGLSIVVRVGGEVKARSAPIQCRTQLASFPQPLTFVVGEVSDDRQLCALVVSNRLIFYSIDGSLVRSLKDLPEARAR